MTRLHRQHFFYDKLHGSTSDYFRLEAPGPSAHIYRIQQLTKSIASEKSNAIVNLHNAIPYQHWTAADLLAERDAKRRYHFKWRLSHVAEADSNIVGLCIAFFDCDSTPAHSYLYLHRIVVAEHFRRRGIGTRLIDQTCRSFLAITADKTYRVLLQTPRPAPLFATTSPKCFYERLGFSIVGEKEYGNRTDLVMQSTIGQVLPPTLVAPIAMQPSEGSSPSTS
jgi:ribosomal protein S18 acetylase RimI-like enzyme